MGNGSWLATGTSSGRGFQEQGKGGAVRYRAPGQRFQARRYRALREYRVAPRIETDEFG